MRPRVVGGEVRSPHEAGHPPGHGRAETIRPARERVEPANGHGEERKVADDGDLPRQTPARWEAEACGVEHDEPLDALGVPRREREADHPAPVVKDERDVLRDAETVEQTLEVIDPTVEDVLVAVVPRLVGQAAADVVGDDRPVRAGESPATR